MKLNNNIISTNLSNENHRYNKSINDSIKKQENTTSIIVHLCEKMGVKDNDIKSHLYRQYEISRKIYNLKNFCDTDDVNKLSKYNDTLRNIEEFYQIKTNFHTSTIYGINDPNEGLLRIKLQWDTLEFFLKHANLSLLNTNSNLNNIFSYAVSDAHIRDLDDRYPFNKNDLSNFEEPVIYYKNLTLKKNVSLPSVELFLKIKNKKVEEIKLNINNVHLIKHIGCGTFAGEIVKLINDIIGIHFVCQEKEIMVPFARWKNYTGENLKQTVSSLFLNMQFNEELKTYLEYDPNGKSPYYCIKKQIRYGSKNFIYWRTVEFITKIAPLIKHIKTLNITNPADRLLDFLKPGIKLEEMKYKLNNKDIEFNCIEKSMIKKLITELEEEKNKQIQNLKIEGDSSYNSISGRNYSHSIYYNSFEKLNSNYKTANFSEEEINIFFYNELNIRFTDRIYQSAFNISNYFGIKNLKKLIENSDKIYEMKNFTRLYFNNIFENNCTFLLPQLCFNADNVKIPCNNSNFEDYFPVGVGGRLEVPEGSSKNWAVLRDPPTISTEIVNITQSIPTPIFDELKETFTGDNKNSMYTTIPTTYNIDIFEPKTYGKENESKYTKNLAYALGFGICSFFIALIAFTLVIISCDKKSRNSTKNNH